MIPVRDVIEWGGPGAAGQTSTAAVQVGKFCASGLLRSLKPKRRAQFQFPKHSVAQVATGTLVTVAMA